MFSCFFFFLSFFELFRENNARYYIWICLPSKLFTWNIKSYFLRKIKTKSSRRSAAVVDGTLTLSPLSFWHGLFHLWIWTHSFFVTNSSFSQNNKMPNSVDPDETAPYEPSHQDLHCLQRYLYWSIGLKGLIMGGIIRNAPVDSKLIQKILKIINRRWKYGIQTISPQLIEIKILVSASG